MKPLLADIAARVRRDIDTFVPPEPHPEQLGLPLPPEWFACQLKEMRAALVEPYVLTVMGDDDRPSERSVVIVAQDEDTFLAFDPSPDGDFALIFRQAAVLGLSNIRGDAVSTFMSR